MMRGMEQCGVARNVSVQKAFVKAVFQQVASFSSKLAAADTLLGVKDAVRTQLATFTGG